MDKRERSERTATYSPHNYLHHLPQDCDWDPEVTKILMLLVVAFTQTHGGAEMSPVNLEGVGARITEGMLSLTLHQLLQNLP